MADNRDDLERRMETLENTVEDMRVAAARLEGEMTYIRRALDVYERQEAAEASAALEVRKTQALELIREGGAERNHRRELTMKVMAVVVTIATAVAAILGS